MKGSTRGAGRFGWGLAVLIVQGLTALPSSALPPPVNPGDDGTSAREVFKQRILPIFRSSKPSSCTECHLGAVDLKDYISRDQAQTFASLRKAGLVNLDNPDESKILTLIQMSEKESSPLTREMRIKEYEAFQAWLREAVKDPALATAKVRGKPAAPSAPVEVIRHARKDRLLASFVENIWSERMRCINCHGPGEPPVPKQQAKKREWIKKYGEKVLIWLKDGSPKEAMDHLLKSRVINLKQPAKSLILTKPTTQVKHEGGKKMTPGDRAYRQFLRFVRDYAMIRANKYRSEKQLPGYVKTGQWLRVRGVPSQRFVLMQVDIHRVERGRPSREPFARAIGGVGRGTWQAPVELLVSRTSKEFEELAKTKKLPPGSYQLRFYVDVRSKLQRSPFYRFGAQDLSGVEEISANNWPEDRNSEADLVKPMARTAKEIEFPARRK